MSTAMVVYLFRQERLASAGQNIAVGSGGVASGVLGLFSVALLFASLLLVGRSIARSAACPLNP